MSVKIITVAFCPAAQLARSLFEFNNKFISDEYEHYVVMGHYPINRAKNNRDIEMIVKSYGKAELLDPAEDLGSAQSQFWALNKIRMEDDDYWVNWDPDSNCRNFNVLDHMQMVLDDDPNCIVISSRAPLIEKVIAARKQTFQVKKTPKYGVEYGILEQPTPFNLSMWRWSFFKQLGCIPQLGSKWGEVEAGVHHAAKAHGKYQAFLMNHMEDESGKKMQDRQLLEYKDKYLRTSGPDQFIGFYSEYLEAHYPEALKLNTFIDDNTEFQ